MFSTDCPQTGSTFPQSFPRLIHRLGKLPMGRNTASNMTSRESGTGKRRDRARERGAAETLAVQALEFLAGDAERLGRFLAMSGIDPEALRAAASEPHFLAGVLDHVTSDERLLLDFATHAEIDPPVVMRAAAALGAAPWERDVP